MTIRLTIDCRDLEIANDCTVSFAADGIEELMEAAVQHLTEVHLESDTPQLRANIRNHIGEQSQPAL